MKLPKLWMCMIEGRAPSPIRHTTYNDAIEAAHALKLKQDKKQISPCRVAIFEMTSYIDLDNKLKQMEPF